MREHRSAMTSLNTNKRENSYSLTRIITCSVINLDFGTFFSQDGSSILRDKYMIIDRTKQIKSKKKYEI